VATYRVKPSRPLAVMGAILGAAVLVFGVVQMANSDDGPGWFLWLWLVFGIAIVSFNLWAAFAKQGSIQTITTDGDEPPSTRLGTHAERQ
jgi:drug/metabolite transporter (DMT)-like permease